MCKLLSLLFSFILGFCTEFSVANASTFYTGFTTTLIGGVGGTAGNGYVFATPIYTFATGSIVDFGIARLVPDPPDGRVGTCAAPYDSPFNSNCYGNGGYTTLFFADGELPETIDPFGTYGTSFIYCNEFMGDCSVDIPILLVLPLGKSRVQLVFQGTSVTNIPATPPQVPLPAALTFFITALGTVGFSKWLKRRGF